MNYFDRLINLHDKGCDEIYSLIFEKGSASKHMTYTPCLKIINDNFKFNLGGGRYLVEISHADLIDDYGYTYNYDVLDYEQFFSLIDYLIEEYS